MGFLLKIVLFGVAAYGLWKTFHRWKSLFDRFVGRPDPAERPAPPPPPPPAPTPPTAVEARRTGPVQDVVPCPSCGAYGAAGVAKCEQCGQPLPQGRSPN